jgi:LUD domain
VADRPTVTAPEVEVPAEFAGLASAERIATAAAALQRNGISSHVTGSGAEARRLVGSLLPEGAEVYNNTSQTLEDIGVADDIERSGRYQPLRLRLYGMDREMQRREMRTLAASPDYVVGSVHALTEAGVAAHRLRQRQPAGRARIRRGAGDPRHRRPEDRQRRSHRHAAHL